MGHVRAPCIPYPVHTKFHDVFIVDNLVIYDCKSFLHNQFSVLGITTTSGNGHVLLLTSDVVGT
jgi:hypothetical protein